VKSLNLFKNTIDVDGCRAIRDLLKINNNIEFLDIGHNRIRSKGLEAITEGINSSQNCKLKTLAVRMNFLNDDAIKSFMKDVVFSNTCELENLYIKYNNISQGASKDLKVALSNQKSKLYVDEFEKLAHINDEERKKRTLWIRCNMIMTGLVFRTNVLAPFKTNLTKTGLVRNIGLKIGHKLKGKTHPHNYMFIEFEDERSAKKCMRLITSHVSSSLTPFLVGSNSYVCIRKSQRKGRR
jgi:hypothetical protein